MPAADQIMLRKESAAQEFNRQAETDIGERFVNSLSSGLCNLKNLGLCRLYNDTLELFAADSMMIPTSPVEIEDRVARELEIYLVVEADRYLRDNTPFAGEWFLDWLGELRFGDDFRDKVKRIAMSYEGQSQQKRRLSFAGRIDRIQPAASRIPLVLYRLLPLAVHGAAAVALGDMLAAQEIRSEQMKLLPEIADCDECHGRPLDNGELCECCHNPIWMYSWLTATD